MTQLQLWAVIAAPSVLAIIGILLNQQGLNRLDHRMEWFEDRMNRFEERLGRLEDLLRKEVRDLLSLIGDYGQRIVRVEERYKP